MKKRLLLMALATTMTLSMLVGCGKEDTKDEATTPATSVEQDSKDDATNAPSNDETKDDSSKEEVKSYNEKFYKEPDWEEEYNELIEKGWKENEATENIEQTKLEYNAMKFVFEDMTQNFKHKKEVTALEPINIKLSPDPKKNTFVCDVLNAQPENAVDSKGEPVVFLRENYTEFAGFDVYQTKAWRYDKKEKTIQVAVRAYDIKGISPLIVNVVLSINEDGSFVYKNIDINSQNYE